MAETLSLTGANGVSEIHIETGPVGLSCRKSGVSGLSQIQPSPIERLTEHGQMDTSTQPASP